MSPLNYISLRYTKHSNVSSISNVTRTLNHNTKPLHKTKDWYVTNNQSRPLYVSLFSFFFGVEQQNMHMEKEFKTRAIINNGTPSRFKKLCQSNSVWVCIVHEDVVSLRRCQLLYAFLTSTSDFLYALLPFVISVSASTQNVG